MNKCLSTVGMKNILLTGRNLYQNQGEGGATIRHEQLGVKGARQNKRQVVIIND